MSGPGTFTKTQEPLTFTLLGILSAYIYIADVDIHFVSSSLEHIHTIAPQNSIGAPAI